MDFFKCPFCNVIKFKLTKYLTHLQLLHNQQPDFSVVCNIEGCNRKYKTVPSFRNRIYRKHREALHPASCSQEKALSEQIEEEDIFDINDNNDEDSERCISGNDLETLLSGLKQHVALFILNLQEKHLLPKVTQDTIVPNFLFILQFFQQHYAEIIKFHLTNSGFKLEDHEDLDNLLSNDSV